MFKNPFVSLVLGILIGIFARYFADIAYNALRHGGLTPKLPFVHVDERGNYRTTDVYLIPFDGFPQGTAASLAAILSDATGLVVKPTAVIPLPRERYNKERDQYPSDALLDAVRKGAEGLSEKRTTIFIGLIADDMYPEGYSWNYSLWTTAGRHSVIATDRFIPKGLGRSEAEYLYGERIVKMLKRVIAQGRFGLPISSDPKSLMFAPIMGVGDIDRMAGDFKFPELPEGD